jgi:hypothetical protein
MDIVEDAGVSCPYCWEMFAISVDTSYATCEMIEDCAVCCRPIHLSIRCRAGSVVSIEAEPG